MRIHTLSLLLLSLMLTACYGQPGRPPAPVGMPWNPMVAGDTVQALSDNIMVVYQDSKNMYWFGSWESGLYRYDGKSRLHYSTRNGLPHDRINAISEDRDGRLYINTGQTPATILQFDGRTFRPLRPQAGGEWSLQPDDLWFMAGGMNGAVYRYDGKILHALNLPQPPALRQPFEIYSIYRDTEGSVWFGTNPLGVCRYNGTGFDWITETDVTELHGGPANGVRSIIQDEEGYFWFNSAYRYRVQEEVGKKGPRFYEREPGIGPLDGKANSDLTEYLSIAKDRQGHLWIATYRNGVWRYDGRRVRHYPVQVQGKDIHVFSITTDRQGTLWLGTHEHGAWRFKGETFVPFTP